MILCYFFIDSLDFEVLKSGKTEQITIKQYEPIALAAPSVDSFPPAKIVWRDKSANTVIKDGDGGKSILSSDGGLYLIGVQKPTQVTCTVENLSTQQQFIKTYDVKVSSGKAIH